MRFGVDSAFYPRLPLEASLERLAKLGWKDVQISAAHLDTGDGGEGRMAAVRTTFERLGITVWQVHSDIELGPTEKHVTAHARWLQCAEAIGARCLITHANQDADFNTEEERQRCLELNRGCLKEVSARAQDMGLRVAIENRLERPWAKCRRFGARMKDLLDLIDAVAAKNVGVCLDTSHTRISRLSFSEEIALCGERLFATQVSDSDGDLQHRMPFTLDIDWGKVIISLKHVGYHGLLTLDCGGGDDVALGMLDEELVAVAERFAPLVDDRET